MYGRFRPGMRRFGYPGRMGRGFGFGFPFLTGFLVGSAFSPYRPYPYYY